MHTRILSTGIIANQPTANFNIYPKAMLEKVIKHFNSRARKSPIFGGFLDHSDIGTVKDKCLITNRLFINDSGMVCAEITPMDNEAGKQLLEKINSNCSMIARPVMCVPSYVNQLKESYKTDPLQISEVHSIVRIQVECDNDTESTVSDPEDHSGR